MATNKIIKPFTTTMTRFFVLSTVILLSLSGCKKEKSETDEAGSFIEIEVQNEVAGQPLKLNFIYTNAFNETFSINQYKYYISNVELMNPTKVVPALGVYALIDASNPTSKMIKASVKSGDYNMLSFLIGVDSARTVSGNQDGALNPSMGMFWDKNRGYMAARLEGTSTFSGAPNQVFQYQIGGYEGQYVALRRVMIPLPTLMKIGSGNTLQVKLRAELLRWFDSIYDLSIANNPVVLTPGPVAMQVADNYSTQFSLSSVEVK